MVKKKRLKCYIRKRKKIIFISDMNKENIKQSLKLKGEYNNIICLNYEKENIKENLIKNVLEEIEKDKLIRI